VEGAGVVDGEDVDEKNEDAMVKSRCAAGCCWLLTAAAGSGRRLCGGCVARQRCAAARADVEETIAAKQEE